MRTLRLALGGMKRRRMVFQHQSFADISQSKGYIDVNKPVLGYMKTCIPRPLATELTNLINFSPASQVTLMSQRKTRGQHCQAPFLLLKVLDVTQHGFKVNLDPFYVMTKLPTMTIEFKSSQLHFSFLGYKCFLAFNAI